MKVLEANFARKMVTKYLFALPPLLYFILIPAFLHPSSYLRPLFEFTYLFETGSRVGLFLKYDSPVAML
jgi:hypothetical protein